MAAVMLDKSDRTVRQWRIDHVANDGIPPEIKQGKYQQTGVLWYNDTLNRKGTKYVRLNASVRGTPNMTTIDICKCVNKFLLPNSTVEPEYPC